VLSGGPGDGSEIIFVGGHHDTQADSVGADDNAVGVAVVIELARRFSQLPRKREVRLISFGAEEQLSVGSAEFVRQHREEIGKRGIFMFNFDAIGSLLGWSELTCNGSQEMADYLRGVFEKHEIYLKLAKKVIPYSDHFPFLAAGIPTAWLGRHNCEVGRFFHHRPDDAIHRISTEIVADQIEAACAALSPLLIEESVPFPLQIDDDQRKEIMEIWESLFGGWKGLRD
jgi:Zn-dependent M28 family amino/carboxypeptidase